MLLLFMTQFILHPPVDNDSKSIIVEKVNFLPFGKYKIAAR